MRGIFVLVLFAFSSAFSQKMANPKEFANSITVEDLKKHLYVIAGKEMQGRETATPGQQKAASYIEEQFRSFGLLPGINGSYQMIYPVFQDSTIGASIEINGQAFQLDKDFTMNAGSSYTATILGSEVLFVGYGISDSLRDDYAGLNARGKIVLVLSDHSDGNARGNEPKNAGSRYSIQEAALKNGAAAVLIIEKNFPRQAGKSKGNSYLNPFKKIIYPNTFTISETVARAIMGEDYESSLSAIKSGNTVSKIYASQAILEFDKTLIRLQSSNVIGFIEGSDKKDEFVILTAHYDHLGKRGDSLIYYGADDDGSGTVSILELAQAFAKAKKEGKGPRRNIIFMTVSGEEKGLWGSQYYSEHPVFPLEKTTVDLNIDMIGRIDPKRQKGDSTNYIYIVGDDKLSTDLRPISETMNNKYCKLELDYKFNDPGDRERIYYRSDHFNFARKGVPIIFYFNGTHNDYHRPTDTADKINYELMKKRAQLVFFTAWEMANRNEMLKRDIPL